MGRVEEEMYMRVILTYKNVEEKSVYIVVVNRVKKKKKKSIEKIF